LEEPLGITVPPFFYLVMLFGIVPNEISFVFFLGVPNSYSYIHGVND